MVGALLGTSTVTSYIESAAGVEQGGRTGLTSLIVAALFVLALFCTPLIAMVASYPPITAPALVLVGAMMVRSVAEIDSRRRDRVAARVPRADRDPAQLLDQRRPRARLRRAPDLKALAGRAREVKPVAALLALVLALWLAFLR